MSEFVLPAKKFGEHLMKRPDHPKFEDKPILLGDWIFIDHFGRRMWGRVQEMRYIQHYDKVWIEIDILNNLIVTDVMILDHRDGSEEKPDA